RQHQICYTSQAINLNSLLYIKYILYATVYLSHIFNLIDCCLQPGQTPLDQLPPAHLINGKFSLLWHKSSSMQSVTYIICNNAAFRRFARCVTKFVIAANRFVHLECYWSK